MAPTTLSIAIVTHAPDGRLLARTLASLAESVACAMAHGTLGTTRLTLVDNGPEGNEATLWNLCEAALERTPGMTFQVISGHGNVGFSQANNLALAHSTGETHLILNPDVELELTALDAGLRHLAEHPRVGAITPSAHGPDGARQFLVKGYPSAPVLFVRAFMPAFLRLPFKGMLERYERREVDWEREQTPVAIASGCFLLCRRAVLEQVGGFDAKYFLYFEDFDLTLRISKVSTITYLPQVRILHHGGKAAMKGLRHIVWFAQSGKRFFSTHGWFGAD